MTSAPIELSAPPAPANGALAPGAGAASGDDALAFAALVDQALAGTGPSTPGPSTPGPSAEGTGDQSAEVAGDPGSPTGTATPAGLEGVLAALLAAALAPPTLGRGFTPTATSPLAATATGAVPGSGPAVQAPVEGAAESPTPPAAASISPVPGTVGSTPAAEVLPTVGSAPGADPGTTPSIDPSTAPATPASHSGSAPQPPDAPAGAAPADAAARAAEATGSTVDGRSVTVVSDAAMRVAGGAGLPAAQPGSTAASHPVAVQVIPEITRLVSDGEGVHRVTLQLNPKALGEVRVVLTMRDGDVHVRIAGGNEARQALAASSAELSRALHHLGLDEHRITLTDLPGTTATTRGGSGSDLGDSRQHAQTTGGNDPNSRDQNSHHSRMGDARHATDGSGTSSPTERNPASARISAVNRTRAAGEVDLRM